MMSEGEEVSRFLSLVNLQSTVGPETDWYRRLLINDELVMGRSE